MRCWIWILAGPCPPAGATYAHREQLGYCVSQPTRWNRVCRRVGRWRIPSFSLRRARGSTVVLRLLLQVGPPAAQRDSEPTLPEQKGLRWMGRSARMGWQGPLIGRKGWGPQTSCLIPFQWQKGPAGLLEEPANLSQSSNSHEECSCRDMKRNLITVIKKTLWVRLLEVTLAPLSPPLGLWTLFVGVASGRLVPAAGQNWREHWKQ